MKKFLVLGSNSFTGSHFVNFLIENKIFVVGMSRSNERNKYFSPYYNNSKKKIFQVF